MEIDRLILTTMTLVVLKLPNKSAGELFDNVCKKTKCSYYTNNEKRVLFCEDIKDHQHDEQKNKCKRIVQLLNAKLLKIYMS